MITGEKLMIYLGVSLILLGMYAILAEAIGVAALGLQSAFGGFISAIGIIMSFVGLKGKEEKPEIAVQETEPRNPLGHLGAASEISIQSKRKSSGNRAFGFVLISVGAFTFALTSGIPLVFFLICCAFDIANIGFISGFLLTPLFLLGIICLSFGIMFRRLKHR
jgi:hypothetical protein